MLAKRLKEFLDKNDIEYLTIAHSLAYTAKGTAMISHVPERELAKTVMIKLDGKMVMVVEPADIHVDMKALQKITHSEKVELASEYEFKDKFPECELGAMPPFGNLYEMEVYVSKHLAEDEFIAFNAGTHAELIRMKYKDYFNLVKPTAVNL